MNLSENTLQKLDELVESLVRDNPKLARRLKCVVLRDVGGTLALTRKGHTIEQRERWFWKNVKRDEQTNCWIWQGMKDDKGYGFFKTKGQRWLAHRAALFYVFGPSKLWGCHRCNNPPCVNPFHVYYGTQSDNWRDMKLAGRGPNPVGSSNGRARLTEHDVAFIRGADLTLQEIGDMFDMSKQNVWKVRSGFMWKHVADKGLRGKKSSRNLNRSTMPQDASHHEATDY